MALTTLIAQQSLVEIMTPKLEKMAASGGGSEECKKLAQAISSSIVEWLTTFGGDAVEQVESMVTTQVTTNTGTGSGSGTVVQFTGKIK